ncbi:unnamed protein product, partial [Meganyctiphanes norvegica]
MIRPVAGFVMELDDLKCPICLEVLTDPVMLPLCGHSLCRSCLISLTPQPPLCPICRTQHHGLTAHQLPTNYIVANLIRQQNSADDSNMSMSQCPISSSGNLSVTSVPARSHFNSQEDTEAPSAPPLSDILDTEEGLVLSAVALAQESHLLNLTSETIVTEQIQTSTESTDVSIIEVPIIVTEDESNQSQTQREPTEVINSQQNISQSNINASIENPTNTETAESNNTNLYTSFSGMNTIQSTMSFQELDSNSRHLFSVLRDTQLSEPVQRSSTPILQLTQIPPIQIKMTEPTLFECKQIIAGLILSLVALIFLTSYSWMIISSIFSTGFKMKFENIYILIGGTCGLPTFVHLACRLIKGKSSIVEKCFYVIYFIFNIVMFFIGIIFVKELKTLILVNSPFALIASISMIISALSVTHFPATPSLRSKSCCGMFMGCTLLFIFTLSLFGGYIAIIGIGYYYFIDFDQIYLLTAGAVGILMILHGVCFVINGRRLCCENYLGCIYFVYSIVWCITGLVLVDRTAFWIVNGPMFAITGLIILFWSIRVTALSLTPFVPMNQSSSCF